ncbi:MAG: ABC transporter ATP-binding protein/permease [Lachnospiraceae bacterium]|jgi:ABC-type multidrug transport system fused ATPase/permease subunit|nr:ABC transporter ATP-binding protein/permease [Lachnospiraceae bacterium]
MGYYIKQHKGLFSLTVFLGVLVSLINTFIAVLLQRIMDAAVGGDRDGFLGMLLFSACYFAVFSLITYFSMLTYKRVICVIINSIRQKVFTGIIKRNYADFNKVNTADYLSALTNDVKLVEDNFLEPLFVIIQFSVMLIASIAVMFYFDVIMAICVLGSILLMLIVPSLFGNAIQKRQEYFSGKLSDFTIHAKDMLSGFEVIKSFAMTLYITGRFGKSNRDTTEAKYGVDKIMAANEMVSLFFGVFIQIGVIFLAAWFIITGRITVGVMIGMTQATGLIFQPLTIIFQNLPKLKGAKPIIERLNELADYESEDFIGTATPSHSKSISAQNLTFSYDGTKQVLKGTTVDFHKGGKYALIGKNGCGKSTLVKLLCGYYADYQGGVYYDGKELKELDYDCLTGLSASIHQNVYVFNESIRDNICLHQEYSDSDLQNALDLSGVSGFINEFPEGLATIAHENGANFSGGQKQRIAVARAIIQGKPILVLDEGTSAIDTQTAFDIENSLLAIKDLTLITITHNLSEENLSRYDYIIRMKDGVVDEVIG